MRQSFSTTEPRAGEERALSLAVTATVVEEGQQSGIRWPHCCSLRAPPPSTTAETESSATTMVCGREGANNSSAIAHSNALPAGASDRPLVLIRHSYHIAWDSFTLEAFGCRWPSSLTRRRRFVAQNTPLMEDSRETISSAEVSLLARALFFAAGGGGHTAATADESSGGMRRMRPRTDRQLARGAPSRVGEKQRRHAQPLPGPGSRTRERETRRRAPSC